MAAIGKQESFNSAVQQGQVLFAHPGLWKAQHVRRIGTEKAFWASPGPHLRKSTLSRNISCLDLPRNLYEGRTSEDNDIEICDVNSDYAATLLAGQLLDANELRDALVETIRRMDARGLDDVSDIDDGDAIPG